MLRALAGYVAVAALKLLSLFPLNVIVVLGTPFLFLYIPFKRRIRRLLSTAKSDIPFRMPSVFAYYRMRLRLAVLSLRHLMGKENGLPIRIEGEEYYANALANGKPIVLLGWHQGPVELLHQIPSVPDDHRPFFVFTGKGFSPTLTRLLHKGRRQNGKHSVEPKNQPAALRSWARRRGVLAVMIDQVAGRPHDWLSLWKGAIEIPVPQNLLEWTREKDAIFIAVSVRLENRNTILFHYQPVKDLNGLQTLIENAVEENPGQYNWSYPKIRMKGKTER